MRVMKVIPGRRTPKMQESRPTWQAAFLVFVILAVPVFVLLTLIGWLV